VRCIVTPCFFCSATKRAEASAAATISGVPAWRASWYAACSCEVAVCSRRSMAVCGRGRHQPAATLMTRVDAVERVSSVSARTEDLHEVLELVLVAGLVGVAADAAAGAHRRLQRQPHAVVVEAVGGQALLGLGGVLREGLGELRGAPLD
jgi:hypothetical protein